MAVGDFSGGSVVENEPADAGDTGWTPDTGRSHMLQGNKVPVPQLFSLYYKPWNCNYWTGVLKLLKPECSRGYAPQRERQSQLEIVHRS